MEIQIWNLKFRIQSVSAKKAEPNKQGKNKRLPVNGSPFCFGMIPAAARPCAAIDRITGRIGHLVIVPSRTSHMYGEVVSDEGAPLSRSSASDPPGTSRQT